MKKTFLAVLISTTFFSAAALAGSEITNNKSAMVEEKITVNEALIEKTLSADQISDLRLNSIRDAVYTVSLQIAVNDSYNKIEKHLEDDEINLSRMFDFSSFLLANNRMLPAIITESEDNLRLLSDDEAVASLTSYHIERDARIVSRDLSWRDYLLVADYPVQKLSPILKPKNSAEQKVWNEAEAQGKHDGEEQAHLLYLDNLARLKRDGAGAIRFHRLLKQGVITKPILATGKTAAEINGKTLSIGHTVYQLTEHTVYQEADKWKVKPSQMSR